MNKPFISAADRNKGCILSHLENLFSNSSKVLELGSGTGQHAVHFAKKLGHLTWQTSDLKHNLSGISAWITDSHCQNLLEPIELDVRKWPSLTGRYDAIYSSNTIHYIEEKYVPTFFNESANSLSVGGTFVLYGPFKLNGSYSSEGDLQLDLFLKQENEHYGLRDMNDLCAIALNSGMSLTEKIDLPANNKLIVWSKEK